MGDEIEAVAETVVPLGVRDMAPLAVPQGWYQVYAWLDLGEAGRIDPGDYLFESLPRQFIEGESVHVEMLLEEVH